ncbi:RDD family protein [Ferruginibacter yonginensis]|uniref:RDD family protein n=1 Tax=Ferruginibacter yonginensis TaxID=1310416 RepID=A0ABV8QW71_9BACT
MASVQINTAFNVALDFEIAPFHKRLVAYFIDFILLLTYLYFWKYMLYDVMNLGVREHMGLDILLISVPMLFYSLLTELLMNGQTIGKKLMGIRVISLDGGEPTLGQFMLRWITKFFEWPFLFGYIYASHIMIIIFALYTCFFGIAVVILIIATKNSQRLGDLAAGTVIVNAKTSMNINDTIFMEIDEATYQVSFPQVMQLSDNDINTIKTVITQARKNNNHNVAIRIEYKVKDVLKIESRLSSVDFLEKLMEDYNYLATKE